MKDLFGNEKIMALSWKEPFASLMLHGKIETRTWNTNYRGLVLICASKKTYGNKELDSISGIPQILRIVKFLKYEHYPSNCGYAIAIGRLVNCRPMQPNDEDKCFVKYYPDLYCHIYEDVRRIKSIAWKGTQGWKKVSQDIIDLIEYE